MSQLLLSINALSISFGNAKNPIEVVHDISFSVNENEIVGIVGESGSGKSVTSLAIMGLLPKKNTHIKGAVLFKSSELTSLKNSEARKIRGKEIAMIFQEPMSALNPSLKCGLQVA
ncbi:MAG: peptide/nickel transport system ATP-binding protein, partial [Candidatus Azotimanducaceae bacterium]